MKYVILVLAVFVNSLQVHSQKMANETYLQIGKRCPDFVLTDIEYYFKGRATLNDFRGKWLILDFWGPYCSACLTGMSRIDSLQKQFSNKIQFLLIGYTGSQYSLPRQPCDLLTRKIFEEIRQKDSISLPVVYDSLLFDRFRITSFPITVVIDPEGNVRGLTYSLSSENIADFLNGKRPQLVELNPVDWKPNGEKYDYKTTYFSYRNVPNENSVLYQSVLIAWDSSMPKEDPGIGIERAFQVSQGKKRFEILKISLSDLYKYAFLGRLDWNYGDSLYGKYFPFLLIETKDSSLFRPNFATGSNIYCYSLIVPPAKGNRTLLMQIMQGDLNHYFGYKVITETRLLPYWKLVVSSGKQKDRFRTKGGQYSFKIFANTNMGFEANNITTQEFIGIVASHIGDGLPVIDETGITTNIDVAIHSLMIDFENTKLALKSIGLDLIKGEREMQVLVIKDRGE